nr:hypothetical protein PanWU01x14_119110 [Ipomoea batatas]
MIVVHVNSSLLLISSNNFPADSIKSNEDTKGEDAHLTYTNKRAFCIDVIVPVPNLITAQCSCWQCNSQSAISAKAASTLVELGVPGSRIRSNHGGSSNNIRLGNFVEQVACVGEVGGLVVDIDEAVKDVDTGLEAGGDHVGMDGSSKRRRSRAVYV